jgi:nicotinamide-nucleotide amidase
MPPPVIWIISTGTELLQGYYTDRNSPWISAQLHEMGLATARHMALPDKAEKLREGLALAAREADLVITTGGLGPTGDDLNRQVIADIWGIGLEENAEALERIQERYRRRGRQMTDNNRVQALIPRGGVPLQNDNGTAPGFYIDARRLGSAAPRASLLALPGPPKEMQPMFAAQAASLVSEQFGGRSVRLRTLTLHTACIPESQIDAAVKDLFEAEPLVNFALLAAMGHVQIRLTFMAADDTANAELEQIWREKIYSRIGVDSIYGEQDDTLEVVVGRLLAERKQTLALAESCTGGLLAGRLTDVPGSSDYLLEGCVTYSNAAKQARLGVAHDLLAAHGAVSAEVAGAMAEGIQATAGSDWALSVTGIAGPGGGTAEKPVGLVFLGVAGPEGAARVVRHQFLGDRATVRSQAVQAGLDLLRRAMLGYPLQAPELFLTRR